MIAVNEFEALKVEKNDLAEFKIAKEKEAHEEEAKQMFAKMQLSDEDVKALDIHSFSMSDLENQCFAILGRKIAEGKQFSLEQPDTTKVKIQVSKQATNESIYKELVEKYGN